MLGGAEVAYELCPCGWPGRASDDPYGAVVLAELRELVAHGAGAELVLVEDPFTERGVLDGVGGLACAWWAGDQDDPAGHAEKTTIGLTW